MNVAGRYADDSATATTTAAVSVSYTQFPLVK